MVNEPTGSEDVLKVATPPVSVPVPIGVVPRMNVIVSPLGGVPKGEVTVAVNVTVCPKCEGLPDVARVVVVFAGRFLTTWRMVGAVLPLWLLSPE